MKKKTKKNKTWFGIRSSAIVESLLFILFLLCVDQIWGQGNRFWNLQPHPFWIPLLLVAVQYGTNEALMTVILCTAALLTFNLPDYDLNQDLFQYTMTLITTPLLWLGTAVILGEMRQKQRTLFKDVEGQLTQSKKREEEIGEAYEKLRVHREALQKQIAGNFHTTLDTFQNLLQLETLESENVLSRSATFVSEVLKPQKFSLFLLKGDKLECVLKHGWQSETEYRNRISNSTKLYRSIIEKKETLCCIHSEHERILGNEGHLAGPLLDPDRNTVLGMLKFEAIAFPDLNITAVETFRLLCSWIGGAYGNAKEHEKLKEQSLTAEGSPLYSYSFYEQQKDFLIALGKRFGFELSEIILQVKKEEKKSHLGHLLHQAVANTLRKTDQAFETSKDSSRYAVLLPNTPLKQTGKVREHLRHILGKEWDKVKCTSQALLTEEELKVPISRENPRQ